MAAPQLPWERCQLRGDFTGSGGWAGPAWAPSKGLGKRAEGQRGQGSAWRSAWGRGPRPHPAPSGGAQGPPSLGAGRVGDTRPKPPQASVSPSRKRRADHKQALWLWLSVTGTRPGPQGHCPPCMNHGQGGFPPPPSKPCSAGAGGDCWGEEGPSRRPLARPPPGRPPRASRCRRHCLGLPWGRAAAASAAHLSGLTRGCGHHRGARAGGAHARARRLRPHAARRRCGGARGPAGPHAGLGHWPPQRVGGSGRLFPSPPRISPTALRGVQDVPPTSSERSRGTEKGGDSPKVTEPREVPERVGLGGRQEPQRRPRPRPCPPPPPAPGSCGGGGTFTSAFPAYGSASDAQRGS